MNTAVWVAVDLPFSSSHTKLQIKQRFRIWILLDNDVLFLFGIAFLSAALLQPVSVVALSKHKDFIVIICLFFFLIGSISLGAHLTTTASPS